MGLSKGTLLPEDGCQPEAEVESIRKKVQRFLQAHKSQLGFRSLVDFLPGAVDNLRAAVDNVDNINVESI